MVLALLFRNTMIAFKNSLKEQLVAK
jgi:hypothetical protein